MIYERRRKATLTRARHARADPLALPHAHRLGEAVHLETARTVVVDLRAQREDLLTFHPIVVSMLHLLWTGAFTCGGVSHMLEIIVRCINMQMVYNSSSDTTDWHYFLSAFIVCKYFG